MDTTALPSAQWQAVLGLVMLVLLAVSVRALIRVLRSLRATGGRVATQHVQLPDLLIALVFTGMFMAMAAAQFSKAMPTKLVMEDTQAELGETAVEEEPVVESPELPEVTPGVMLAGSALLLLLAGGAFGFAKFRGIPLHAFWGAYGPGRPLELTRLPERRTPPVEPTPELADGAEPLPPPLPRTAMLAHPAPLPALGRGVRIVGSAFGFLLLLFPALAIFSSLYAKLLPKEATGEQQVVSLFRQQVEAGDLLNIGTLILAAAVLAPLLEEALFRGYLYPVFKRYFGPWVAVPIVALLFMAVHANVVSAMGLFLLALTLTLAFEWSGSLWVPIAMHAIFNSLQLVALYIHTITTAAP